MRDDGSGGNQILDGGAIRETERTDEVVGPGNVDIKRVSVAIERAFKGMISIGTYHVGDRDILHQFEKLVFVTGATVDAGCQQVPLVGIIDQVGVVRRSGVFGFPIDVLLFDGDAGVSLHVEGVALNGRAIHGVDVTFARGWWSGGIEGDRSTGLVVVRFIVRKSDGGTGGDARSKAKREDRACAVIDGNIPSTATYSGSVAIHVAVEIIVVREGATIITCNNARVGVAADNHGILHKQVGNGAIEELPENALVFVSPHDADATDGFTISIEMSAERIVSEANDGVVVLHVAVVLHVVHQFEVHAAV